MSAVVGPQDDRRKTPADSASATARGEPAAEWILATVFREVPFGFAVRLWNGVRIHLGPKGEPFTLVFRTREAFRRLVLRPNTLRFALAFADGDLDIEGDFFDALHLAQRIEALHLRLRDRLAIVAALAKV